LQVKVTAGRPLATVTQTLTHRELVLEIVQLCSDGPVRPRARAPVPAAAVAPADAPPGALSTAARRALEAARAATGPTLRAAEPSVSARPSRARR
jgi:hypothetical protein